MNRQKADDIFEKRDVPEGISPLGTHIMSNVRFVAPPKEYRIGKSDAFENNERLVINDVILSVSQSKTIVKTQLVQPQGYASNPAQGAQDSRNVGYIGTVKEYISQGDFSIRMQGWITSEEIDIFPIEKLTNLLEYLNYPGAFNMYGKYVDAFDLNQVVVKDYNVSEERGFSSQVPFTCNLLSDSYLTVKYEPAQTGVYVPFTEPT